MSALEHCLCLVRPGFVRWIAGPFAARLRTPMLIASLFIAMRADATFAACGDYLRGAHRDGRISENLRGLLLIATERVEATPQTPSDSSKPHCSGPFCQQLPILPIHLPPTDLRLPAFKEAFYVLPLEVSRDEEWFLLGRSSDRSPASPDRNRLDRPPQAA